MKIYLEESLEETCKIPKEALDDNSLITLLEYSCLMKIEIDKKIYFYEGICPLELLHELRKWTEDIQQGKSCDLIYNTEDDANNPVLKFKRSGKGWRIYSCWEKYQETKIFETKDLLGLFEMFKSELNKFIF